jgi:hypothetical protein
MSFFLRSATAFDFGTQAAGSGDSDAPTITAGPTISGESSTAFNIALTADENCTARVLVTSLAANQPSNSAFDASEETAVLVAGGEGTISITGQTPGALYKVWMQLADLSGNRTTVSENVYLHPAGYERVIIGTIDSDPDNRLTTSPDTAPAGAVALWGSLVNFDSVTVNDDLSFDGVQTDELQSSTFDWFIVDVDGGDIGTVAVQTVEAVQPEAPTMPADAAVTVDENETVVGTYAATAGTGTITYTLGGTDAARFNIDSGTGAVTFASAPDYEAPADADSDNKQRGKRQPGDYSYCCECRRRYNTELVHVCANNWRGSIYRNHIECDHSRGYRWPGQYLSFRRTVQSRRRELDE